MKISDLRFGVLPPLFKNMKWVPTSALQDADVNYDIAFNADMVYLVRKSRGVVYMSYRFTDMIAIMCFNTIKIYLYILLSA